MRETVNDTPSLVEVPLTLGDLPRMAAQRHGAKTALICSEGAFTFAEIERDVLRLSTELAALGLGPGDHVILHLPNGRLWIVAYYAIVRVGAVAVPANILLVPEEVGYIARDCEAGAIIAPSDRKSAILTWSTTESFKHYISTGASSDEPMSLEAMLERCDIAQDPIPGEWKLAPSDISMISYTSGTTGEPKGVVLTHYSVLLNAQLTSTMHVRTAHDVVVTALPCAHVYGYIVMNSAFLCGSTLVLIDRFDPDLVLDSISRHRATILDGVPTMYYYLLDRLTPDHDVSSLTRCTVGGQTMTMTQMLQVEAKLGCRLLELWGMTELAGLGTTHSLYGPRKLGSIGIPMPFMECRIAAIDNPRRTLGDNELGEVMTRGPTAMQKYWGRPEETAETLEEDGWLHSGDVGYRDEDGFYFIVDRNRDMIITAGYNIYPSEIESVIAQLDGVSMVAVGPIPDTNKGELPKAYVVLKAGAVLSIERVMEHCRSHLAAYKLPRAVEFVARLPQTSTGKIRRGALRSHASRNTNLPADTER
jgi:long-chain acyl-CoA synthetase